jgi:DNA-binding CsgD family transcriptional regulator
MQSDRTAGDASPLAGFLRMRVERVLATFQAAAVPPATNLERGALERFLRALDDLAAAADALTSTTRKLAAVHDPAVPTILVAAADPVADAVRRSVGPGYRVVVAPARERVAREALELRPTVIVGSGAAGQELIGRVHALQPGIPAVLSASDSEVPALLEAFASDPVIVLKSPTAEQVGSVVRALLSAAGSSEPPGTTQASAGSGPGGQQLEPRSYAHLAGLLPRALERSVRFDVGAAVIARPGADPVVDVHAASSECSDQTLELVRQRALALFKLIVGGVRSDEDFLGRPAQLPLRSSMYFPLASEGGVVGLTYLASFQESAFSPEDERVLAELASHASGAYRRLESSVHRLRLSPRQSQVLALIASGLSDKEVASRLGVAHRTVRTHVDRLLREHGLRSRTEAVAAWLRGQQS